MHSYRDSNKLAEEGNTAANRAEAPVAARIGTKSYKPVHDQVTVDKVVQRQEQKACREHL